VLKSYRPSQWRALPALVPLAWVLLAGQLLADADHCGVCGARFTARVYTVTDQVTGEKVQVCPDCAVLSTVCFICGLPVRTNYTELPDGRILCARDARTAVLNEDDGKRICREAKDNLDRLFSRFLNFPETNVTVAIVDRVHLQELFKFAGHDYTCPNIWGYMETRTNRHHLEHTISLLSGLPLAGFKATCAHEYTHAWLNENLSEQRMKGLSRDANEGFCELVSYRLMEAQNEEAQKKLILSNAYTRGQIHLFLEAEKLYGFNDIVDWMKFGADDRLAGDDLRRIRNVELLHAAARPATNSPAYSSAVSSVPDTLVLRGIYWAQARPLAIINNRTLGVNEEGKVRVGKTNVTIRCLAIGQDGVRIRIVGTGEERELRLKTAPR
jgi:hypothetical protein